MLQSNLNNIYMKGTFNFTQVLKKIKKNTLLRLWQHSYHNTRIEKGWIGPKDSQSWKTVSFSPSSAGYISQSHLPSVVPSCTWSYRSYQKLWYLRRFAEWNYSSSNHKKQYNSVLDQLFLSFKEQKELLLSKTYTLDTSKFDFTCFIKR